MKNISDFPVPLLVPQSLLVYLHVALKELKWFPEELKHI